MGGPDLLSETELEIAEDALGRSILMTKSDDEADAEKEVCIDVASVEGLRPDDSPLLDAPKLALLLNEADEMEELNAKLEDDEESARLDEIDDDSCALTQVPASRASAEAPRRKCKVGIGWNNIHKEIVGNLIKGC
jgi:hypothetical protein